MFEEILDLPLHPLAVHAPIVLVPLLVLVAIAYALVPRLRQYVAWAAALLAVVTPLAALVAKLSGDAFGERSYGADLPEAVLTHQSYGDRLLWSSIALGVLTLALVWVRHGAGANVRKWAGWPLAVLVVVAAGTAAVSIFLVGHSGSEMVWQGR